MDYDSCRSLPAMFFEQADRLGDKPFLWAKRDGRYQAVSWAETARDVRRLALGLKSLGIGRGERIGLVSENRPEWIIADLAIMSAGAITVPAYVTHTIEDYRYVLANSGARAVIVSKPGLSARVLAAANQVDTVHTVIAMERATGQASAVDLLLWNEILARGAEQFDRRHPEGRHDDPPQHPGELPRRPSCTRDAGAGRRRVPELSAAVAFL